MNNITSYRDLVAWQKAYQLTLLIYKTTIKFPGHEIYGITSQMRRAALSIPSNIAEGYRRQHTNEYIQFLSIARASLGELETQTMIAGDLGYFNGTAADHSSIQNLQDELGKILFSLIVSLRKKKCDN